MLCIRQVTGAVRWEPSVRVLIDKGASLFVELARGKFCGADAADRPLENVSDGWRRSVIAEDAGPSCGGGVRVLE